MDSYVQAFTRSPNGVLWITHNSVGGLSRLDGRQVSRIPGPPLDNFDSFDGTNGWSVRNSSLDRLENGVWKTFPLPISAGNPIGVLDLGNTTAVVLFEDRIVRFSGIEGKFRAVDLPQAASLGRLSQINRDPNGTIWVSGDRGVASLRNPASAQEITISRVYSAADAGLESLQTVLGGADGELFFSGVERGTRKRLALGRLNGKWTRLAERGPSGGMLRVWRGKYRELWLVDGNTLSRQTPRGEWEKIDQQDEVISGTIRSVVVNPDGSFALATSRGLALHVNTDWRNMVPEGGGSLLSLERNLVASIADRKGRLWFAAEHTLIRHDHGRWDQFPFPASYTIDTNQSTIAETEDGRILIPLHGTPGLAVFDPLSARYSTLPVPDGYEVLLFTKRRAGGFWVALDGKTGKPDMLGILEHNAFARQTVLDNRWSPGTSRAMLEDPDGNVWYAGTAGLRRRRPGSKSIESIGLYQKGKEVPLGSIFSLYLEPDGQILVGGRNTTWRWNGRELQPVTTAIEIPRRFLRDRQGRFWVASVRGVQQAVTREPGIPKVGDDWIVNTSFDGLPSTVTQSIVEDSEGRIWAATNRGPAIYEGGIDPGAPAPFVDAAKNPRSVIEGEEARVVFSGSDRWDQSPPEMLRFSFRFDNGTWSPFQDATSVSVRNLAAGTHKFELMAIDRQGNISPAPAVFEFAVLARWYRSPGFLILSVLVSGIIGLLTRQAFRHQGEKNRLIRQLSEACAAAEANSKAKSEFLANMSHEIRTPMNGMIGMTDLALQSNPNAEQKEYLEMARSSGYALLSVINDILDFSKIEAGKLELSPETFDLRNNLRNTLRAIGVRAHEKGLEIAYEVAPDVPEHLVGDPGRLRQIVLNLVSNAIKFTEHGEVVLKVEAFSQGDSKACLHFSVRDTGIGIPPEKHHMIFEAFSQADSTTTRHFGGTGLGLSISRQLVTMMGGRMWLESEPGKGSEFHFSVEFEVGVAPVQRSGAAISPLDMKVLVVDDNATNRRILQEMLKSRGSPVVTADGGAAALAALEADRFDLMLVDINMPGMNGLELAARVRGTALEAGARKDTTMKIAALSSIGADPGRLRLKNVDAYLSKPLGIADLFTLVDELFPQATGAIQVTDGCASDSQRAVFGVPLRILVAEDNPVNQILARRILEKAGYEVVVAADGRKAIQAWEEASYDVILMDLQMPLLDGYAACSLIREQEAARNLGRVPIIAVTAHALEEERDRCLKAGMDAFVSKPIRREELLNALETIARTEPVVTSR